MISLHDGLQTAGGLLQLGGVLTIAIDIADTRRRFSSRSGIIQSLVKHFHDTVHRLLPRAQTRTVEHSADAVLSGEGHLTATPTVERGRWEILSVEARLDRLKNMIDATQAQAARDRERADTKLDELRRDLNTESATRAQADQQNAEKLGDLAAGGLRRAAWGALAFGSGITLATWSTEIADWLRAILR